MTTFNALPGRSNLTKKFSPEEINVLTIIESFKMVPLPQYPFISTGTLNQRKVLRMSLMTSEDNKS